MRPVGETDAMEFEAMWDAIPPIDQDDVDRLLASGEIEALDLQGYYDYRGHADDLSESLEKFAKGTAVPRNWRGNNPKENPRPPTGGVTDIHPYFAAVAERDGRTPRTFEYEVPISLQSGRYEGPASAHSASPAFPGVSPGFASPVDMPQNYGAGSGFQQTPPGLQPMSQSAGMTEGPGLAAALAGSQEHVAGSKRPRSPSPPPETKAKTAVLVLDGLLTFVDCFAPEHRGADALPMIREKGNQCDALCQAGRQLIHEMACKRFFFNELKGGRDALPKQKRPPSHWDPDTDNVSKGIPDDDCLRYRRDRMLDAYEKKFQWNAEEKERFRDYLNQVNWLLEDLPSAMRDFVQALSSQKKTRIVVVSREDHACALAKLALFGLQELAKEQDVLTDTDGYDKIGSALATGRYGEYELVVPSSFKERAALEKNPALVTGTCVVASRSDVGDVQRRFGVKPPPMNE